MAKKKERTMAIKLRLQGKSYSEIKQRLDVSKGTLSSWLQDYPLSPEKIKELRDNNPRRIESFRNTMRLKREKKLDEAYDWAKQDIVSLSKRELFLSGFFLYWAEGTKTNRGTITLANTDPAMIKFFIRWLALLGIRKNMLRVRLHLYSDMDTQKEMRFWSQELKIPMNQFRNPFIKSSKMVDIKYKGGFGHGTCNILFGNQVMMDYVLMGIKYLKETVI